MQARERPWQRCRETFWGLSLKFPRYGQMMQSPRAAFVVPTAEAEHNRGNLYSL